MARKEFAIVPEYSTDGTARHTRIRRANARLTLVLTLPGLLLAATFVIYPVVETVRLSFNNATSFGVSKFVGVANYVALSSDEDFKRAIGNNLIFAVLVTFGTVSIGILLALAIDKKVALWRFYSFIFFLPYIVPMTIVAILWSNAFDPNYGWLTRVINSVAPGFAPNGVLTDPHLAVYAVCAVAIWQTVGFPMVMVLGGLRAIPAEINESAVLDGASGVQVAHHISVPMCRDVIVTVTLLQVIFTFKIFDLVQAMTKGGPGAATQVFGTLIYRDAFMNGQFGYASAIAVVSTVAIVIISLGYLAVFRTGHMQRNG